MRKLIFAILLMLFSASPVWASTIADVEDANDAVATAPIQIAPEPDPNAHVGVLHLGIGDVDFVGLGPLAVGDVLTAVSTPLESDFYSPDTVLGVFDAAGHRLKFNDDSPGVGFGSALSFEVSAEEVYFLAISGYGDPTFQGFHGESGDYALTVSVLPAPSSNAPPDCSAASAAPDGLWPLNQKLADISVLGVSDPDGDDRLVAFDHHINPVALQGSNHVGGFIPVTGAEYHWQAKQHKNCPFSCSIHG